jgi:hypothetical protein
VSGLASGTYGYTVPIVYGAGGLRYAPGANGTGSVTLSKNMTVYVVFVTEVLVAVSTSGSGNATGGGWYASGTSVNLTATAAPAGWVFTGWLGTGPGSYTGSSATPTIYPTGPVTETATYAPHTVTAAATTPVSDWAIIGVVVVVLGAIGLGEGYLLMRRRRPPPSTPTKPATAAGSPTSRPPPPTS